jgi:hypothetical protein
VRTEESSVRRRDQKESGPGVQLVRDQVCGFEKEMAPSGLVLLRNPVGAPRPFAICFSATTGINDLGLGVPFCVGARRRRRSAGVADRGPLTGGGALVWLFGVVWRSGSGHVR